MGLLSLADYLARNGIRSEVVNLAVERRLNPDFSVVAYVRQRKVRILGISLHWFFQLPDTLELAREVKQSCPEVLVVFGGFTASLFAVDLVNAYPSIDAIVRGDGEVPLLALCQKQLAGQNDWRDIPNLVYRGKDGACSQTPFTHVATEAQLGEYEFANLELLKNWREAFYPLNRFSNRFQERFDFENGGLFLLEIGRGCAYSCSLCGGNRDAQRMAFHRSHPVLRPIPSVLATIRRAMEYGYRNFYICFDPDPSGYYFSRLFDEIRNAKLPIRLGFEPWGLPSLSLIDALADAFPDALIVLSADSANEEVRRLHKGALAFGNRELMDCLAHIKARGLACQVFFGFLLPGDSPQSVMQTRRMVYQLEREFDCETIYMAFSTDPRSPAALYSRVYDMQVDVRGLTDYLDALTRSRLTPDLMAHRPAKLSAQEADRLIVMLNLDTLLHKALPVSLRCTYAWAEASFATVDDMIEEFLESCSQLFDSQTRGLVTGTVAGEFLGHLRRNASLYADKIGPLCDLVTYESTPYVLREQLLGRTEVHHSRICRERPIDVDSRKRELQSDNAVESEVVLEYDVRSCIGVLAGSMIPVPSREHVRLLFHVSRDGHFCANRLPTVA